MNLARIPALLFQSPTFLVWIVGIILALVYWRRHPTVSLLVLLGILLLILNAVLGRTGLPLLRNSIQLRRVLANGLVNLIRSAINALAFALLLAAAFIGRRSRVVVAESQAP